MEKKTIYAHKSKDDLKVIASNEYNENQKKIGRDFISHPIYN